MIIGISGYATSGKDTLAHLIIRQSAIDNGAEKKPVREFLSEYAKYGILPSENDWEIKKFSWKLKVIASVLTGIPAHMFERQDFKADFLSKDWEFYADGDYDSQPYRVRDFLQRLGTEGIRNAVHKDAWVNALMCDYRPDETHPHNPSRWIVTDVRFKNEANAIVRNGGIVVRINRPGLGPTNAHISETELDDYPFHIIVNNASTLEELSDTARVVLRYAERFNELKK